MPITGSASNGGKVRSNRIGLDAMSCCIVAVFLGDLPRGAHDLFPDQEQLSDDA